MPKPQEGEMRQQLNLITNVLMCQSEPSRKLCTKPGTMGWRNAGNVRDLFVFGMMVVWGAVGQSPTLLAASLGFLLIAAIHRFWSGPGHSMSIGESWFDAFTATQPGARRLESLVAVGIGFLCHPDDPGMGWFLIASGIGNLMTVQMIVAREAHIVGDITDAQREQRMRAERIQSPE